MRSGRGTDDDPRECAEENVAAPNTPLPPPPHTPQQSPSPPALPLVLSPRLGPAGRRAPGDPRRAAPVTLRHQPRAWNARRGTLTRGPDATPEAALSPTSARAPRTRLLVGGPDASPHSFPPTPRPRLRPAQHVKREMLLRAAAAAAASGAGSGGTGHDAAPGAEANALHRHLRGWYGTLLRSRHARQADRVLAAYRTDDSDDETPAQAEARRRQAEVEAAARRASGHSAAATTRAGGSSAAHSLRASFASSGKKASEHHGSSHFIPLSDRSFMVRIPSAAATAGSVHHVAAVSLDEGSPLLMKSVPSVSVGSPLPARTEPRMEERPVPKAERVRGFGQRMADFVGASLQANFLRASYRELVGLWVCVVMVLSGNALQVIALNFWLRQFPASYGTPGNYTTLVVSSIMFSAFFLLVLGVYLAMERPDLRFLWHKHGAVLLLCVGCADLACSCLTIYAASHTSEILQALFTSTAPIFTAFFQKHILRDPRSYSNPWVAVAFACIITGVLLASSYGVLHPIFVALGIERRRSRHPIGDSESGGGAEGSDGLSHWEELIWSFLFFCSVIPSVVQNVVQTKYMLYFTRDPLFERWVIAQAAAAAAESLHAEGTLTDPDSLTEERNRHMHTGPRCPTCGGARLVPGTSPSSPLSPYLSPTRDECPADVGTAPARLPPSSLWVLKRPDTSASDSHATTSTTHLPSPVVAAPSNADTAAAKPFDFVKAKTYQSPPIRPMSPGVEPCCSNMPTSVRDGRGCPSASSYGTFSSSRQARSPAAQLVDEPLQMPPPLKQEAISAFAEERDDEEEEEVLARSAPCDCTKVWMGYGHIVPGEDLIVKLVLLAVDTTIQAVGALLLLPMDTLPFWGGSRSVSEAADNFARGLSCVLSCDNNLKFCLLYCLGFVFMYIGAVYLDQFSVTFCSMVTQLAAPCTALLLIAYPHLNLAGDYTPWWLSCIAIAFLATGTVLFTAWDQRTTDEKMDGENAVKRDYVKPFLVVERGGIAREYPLAKEQLE